MAFAVILIIAGNACAETQSHLVNISTRVAPALKYQILHEEKELAVTEADIAKGYIDITSGMILTVRTNSRNGYLLWFSVNDNLLQEVTIYSDKNAFRLMQSGGEIHMPYKGQNYVAKELSFRFYFSEEVKPGTYEWPLSIMVSAI